MAVEVTESAPEPERQVLLSEATRDELINALRNKISQFIITGFNTDGPIDDRDTMPFLTMQVDSLEVALGLLSAAGTQLQGAIQARNILWKVRNDHG